MPYNDVPGNNNNNNNNNNNKSRKRRRRRRQRKRHCHQEGQVSVSPPNCLPVHIASPITALSSSSVFPPDQCLTPLSVRLPPPPAPPPFPLPPTLCCFILATNSDGEPTQVMMAARHWREREREGGGGRILYLPG